MSEISPEKFVPAGVLNVINIEIFKEDDVDIPIQITDSSGNAFDFTDFTGSMLVKRRDTDLDSIAVIDFTTAGNTMVFITGQISLKRPGADFANINPGKYVYSIKLTDTAPATPTIETIITGAFRIIEK